MGIDIGAKTAVATCMKVRKGEHVLVVSDREKKDIARAIHDASLEISPHTYFLEMEGVEKPNQEPDALVGAAMREADVVLILTENSLSHTMARKNACRSGARIATFPGIVPAVLEDGGLTADYDEVAQNVRNVHHRVRNLSSGRITTKAGTDIAMDLAGRKWITEDTGLCHARNKFTNLPAGEIFISPVEDSINGTLVIDGSFQHELVEPTSLEIVDGEVTDVKGDSKVEAFFSSLKGRDRYVGTIGFGLNPRSTIKGVLLEDEKTLGSAHIIFGENISSGGVRRSPIRAHSVIRDVSLQMDDTFIIDEGKII